MSSVARGFDLACGFLFAALLTSRVLIFGFEDYSAGNAFVALVCGMLVASSVMAWLARGEVRVARSRAWIPLGAYLLFCLLGVIAASNRAVAWRELGSWMVYGGAFVASASWARTEERRRLVFASFLAAACVEGMYAFFQRRVGLPLVRAELALDPGSAPLFAVLPAARGRLLSNEAFGTFVYPNALAGFLVFAVPVAVAFALQAVRRRKRAYAACLVLVSGVLLLSLLAASAQMVGRTPVVSRGGWVALGAVGALFATRKLWLPRARAVAAAGVGVLVLGSLLTPVAFFLSPLSSFGVRREYWKAALSMIRAHPFGVGLGNFGEHYPAFKTFLGTETRLAHNAFFQNWTELGLWGMLAFAALWWALIADASGEHGASDGDKREGLVYLGLGGGLFAFLVSYGLLDVMNSASIGAFLAGAESPYLGLTAACHMVYPLVWLGVFACAMKTGTRGRAFLACALAGLLVHSAVDFDMRVKGIVLPAFALAGTAGWARGEARFRFGVRGVAALAAGLGVALFAWAYFLAKRPLEQWAAKARAEEMDGWRRRVEAVGGEVALLKESSPSMAAKVFLVLARALPGRELDGAARALEREGADGEEIVRQAMHLLPKVRRTYAARAAEAWVGFAGRARLDPEAHASLAHALGKLRPPNRKVIDAWEHSLKESIRLGPVSPGRWESLAHFCFGRRRFRDASAAYEKAVERYPLKPVYRFYLGDSLLRYSPERARTEYGRALEVNRRVIDDACMLQEMLWNRFAYVRKGRVEPATVELLRKEEGTESRMRLGLLLGALGKRKEAEQTFSELAGRLPEDPQILSFLACARETVLDPRASSTWERLQALRASSPERMHREAVELLMLRRKWMRSVR